MTAKDGSRITSEAHVPDDGDPVVARKRYRTQLRDALGTTVLMSLALLVLFGVAYPAVLYAIAQTAFHESAEGSLVRNARGEVAGSALIGQSFTRPEYFHGRPSAVGYNAAGSGGSNLGPLHPALADSLGARAAAARAENRGSVIPVDLITTSGSGLDPHISPAAAELQVPRVAAARGASPEIVRELVLQHTERRTFGLLGEPRVNVLLLNLAVDSALARMPTR